MIMICGNIGITVITSELLRNKTAVNYALAKHHRHGEESCKSITTSEIDKEERRKELEAMKRYGCNDMFLAAEIERELRELKGR